MMWEPNVIATQVEPYVADYGIDTVSCIDKGTPQFLPLLHQLTLACIRNGNLTLTVLQILTFDGHGVSSHPNHISIIRGIKHMLETKLFAKQPKVYSLTTVSLLQKYTGVFGGVFARFELWLTIIVKGFPGINLFTSDGETTPTFISGAEQYIRALSAMRQHRSQMVWFRWLNVFFSRYMWVNEWEEVDVVQAMKARI
jgi:hypothetical protein